MKLLKELTSEAYDTVPIHPFWGGPAPARFTQTHPYYTTDFYQAMSGGGAEGGAGPAPAPGPSVGVEAEEDFDDEMSFTDFLHSDEDHIYHLKGGWKLYRINNGE